MKKCLFKNTQKVGRAYYHCSAKAFSFHCQTISGTKKKYTIGDGEVIVFGDADEVYHFEQFLGHPKDCEYSFL